MKLKTTHSLEQVEALMWKESNILKDSNVGKERKKEAVKRLKLLEKHFHDCNGKEFNGKKYPIKQMPKDIPKKELLALIDSVKVEDYTNIPSDSSMFTIYMDKNKGLDLSGVFISKEKN